MLERRSCATRMFGRARAHYFFQGALRVSPLDCRIRDPFSTHHVPLWPTKFIALLDNLSSRINPPLQSNRMVIVPGNN